MKVLFVCTNINGFHEGCYPFGLCSIMSVAKVAGWQVEALLIHFREEYTQAVRKAIEFQPDVIGFTTVSSQYHFVKELAVLFKKALPRTVIVCGGVHMTINKDSLLEAEAIDAGFVG